ncbi:SDR family oxidoreductase [Paracoccus sp. Z118]|uniref:SDR family oxidoreductase n=1 Tax=Paracoccus sp. Z118 TaxID=2851017 RepID=UPI001C2C02E8|nr:SDR family oxidoreductase [Paracoccus sp. Z118]MBV0891711.1 SDR family oxidoreductase [Paracoccus sp. Z118]
MMERIGKTAEIVGPTFFLASSWASYITGAVLPVDGGFSPPDRRAAPRRPSCPRSSTFPLPPHGARSALRDWAALDLATGGTMLAQMELIRAFEEKVLELAAQGPVHGAADSAISQKAGAVGSAPSLRPGDQINGSPPAHHQFLAKALSHVAPRGIDPKAELGGDIRLLAKRTHAETFGLSQGFCRGRGESMHLQNHAISAPMPRWATAYP